MPLTTRQNMESFDAYSASIDLSNSCREFYYSRKRMAESSNDNVSKDATEVSSSKPKSFIDEAMATLRKEMATVMDQDLSLIKQLMTMNDTIEEIKFQRFHGGSKDLSTSSCNMSDSEYDIRSMPSMSSLPSMASIPSLSSLVSTSSLNSVFDENECQYSSDEEIDDSCDCSSTVEETEENFESIVSSNRKRFSSRRDTCGSIDSGFGDQGSSDENTDSESEG